MEEKNNMPQIIEVEKPSEMPVHEFFTSVKNSAEELVLVEGKLKSYLTAVDKFKKLGQVAVYERLQVDVEIHKAEAQLFAINKRKYISEDNLVRFVSKSEKGLKLDWIRNFIRLIPEDVANVKMKCDDLEIFDNYVVLHYDPSGKSSEMTVDEKKAEVEKEKDPILFGVLIGSRKLYYLGDWVDEYCDLTLSQIVDKIGNDAVGEITNEIDISGN